MNDLNNAINLCLSKMKVSPDFEDLETTSAIKDLLSIIISHPAQLVNCPYEENLSLVLTSVITSSFTQSYSTFLNLNVRNFVFVCAYYLYMHQLETGYFYDRNWPSFILLIHLCHREFAKFSLQMNSLALEEGTNIIGGNIDYSDIINVSKGVELNLMIAARKKGYFSEDLKPWFDELWKEYDNLFSNCDPFRDAAIPLYFCIGKYLKRNDLSFVNR